MSEARIMQTGMAKLTGRKFRVVLDCERLWIEYSIDDNRWLRVIDKEFLTPSEAVERVHERDAGPLKTGSVS